MNICLEFSMQSLESSIDLHNACDGCNKTKNQSQDKHDHSGPESRPLESIAPVEPPLPHGLGPGVVVCFLHPAETLLPIWVVIQIKHFVRSHG